MLLLSPPKIFRNSAGKSIAEPHSLCYNKKILKIITTSRYQLSSIEGHHIMEAHLPVDDIRIIRSKRRTLCLSIDLQGRLTVKAPQSCSDATIFAAIRNKANWINQKQAWMRSHSSQYSPFCLKEGACLYYLGEPLSVCFADTPEILRQQRRLIIPRQCTLNQISAWYRNAAKQILPPLVEQLAQQAGYQYQSIKINSAMGRWGSCNSRGGLNFTWRLMQTPPAIILYILWHELTHTRYLDHSANFWHALGEHYPDYPQAVAWLRENAAIMSMIPKTPN